MKLSDTQWKVLERLYDGDKLHNVEGMNPYSFWHTGKMHCLNPNTIFKLYKEGFIESLGEYSKKMWVLTEEGKTLVETRRQVLLRDEWYTPDEVYQDLNARYGPFDLDAAASALNAKCKRFIDAKTDALNVDWNGKIVWLNPPYRNIKRWIDKAYWEVEEGNVCRVVMLLPAHTATEWFHFAMAAGKVEFLKGKIKFGGSKGVGFTGSVVVVFGE